jgi:hypothetical protein
MEVWKVETETEVVGKVRKEWKERAKYGNGLRIL